MKKTLISSLLLVTFLLPMSGSVVRAQEATVSQEQFTTLQETLVKLLTEMIAQLQAQITELIAKQAQTTQEVSNVSAKVESKTALGVSENPVPSVTITVPECGATGPYTEKLETSARLTVDGNWNNVSISYLRYPILSGYNSQGYAVLRGQQKQMQTVNVSHTNANIFAFNISAYPETYEMSVKVDGRDAGTQTVTVSACE